MINSTTELLEINRQLELFKQKEVEEQKKEEARQKDEKKRAEDERRQRETQERAKREEAKAQAKQAYQQELQQQAQEVQQQLLQAHQQALHAQQQAGQLPEHLSKLMKAQKYVQLCSPRSNLIGSTKPSWKLEEQQEKSRLINLRSRRTYPPRLSLLTLAFLPQQTYSTPFGAILTPQTIASLRSELSKVEENEASLKASILQQQKSEIQALKEKIKEQEAMINQINEELKVDHNSPSYSFSKEHNPLQQSQSDNALAASRVLDDIKKNGTGLTSISNKYEYVSLLFSFSSASALSSRTCWRR